MGDRLDNLSARRLFLDRHALLEPPSGAASGEALHGLIHRLGFVQIDSVCTVERAHHMILHARRTGYRPAALQRLHERDRRLFEHWTHDAAILPVEFYPRWQLRFARERQTLAERWTGWRRDGYDARFDPVLGHISRHGATLSDAFDDRGERSGKGWWDWHPSKTALEFLWRTGRLAIAGRQGFRKLYDLSERVIPDGHRLPEPPAEETLAWACDAALDRLGLATSGEIAAFWALIAPDEAKAWAAAARDRGEIEEIEVEMADGRPRRLLARPDTAAAARALPPAPGMIRVLSPFDPMIRDRRRTERLFGFHYRIEIFVPAHRRSYGYYVFPLLEGDRLIGRIDMAARRQQGDLRVSRLWLEPGLRLSAGRARRLEAALARTARLARLDAVTYDTGWADP